MKLLGIGDHVRVKDTGEIMVVDARMGTGNLRLSKWGQMAGATNILLDQIEVKREDVVKVVARTEWVDDED
jgi:hypothetical protein